MVHLLIAWVTLPAFNPFCSARELGESLARSADGGVRLMSWGFHNREEVSPLMFYANRPLPEIRSRHHLGRILPGERACAVVPAVAYPRLPPPLRALPSEKWHIGGLRLKLVSGTTGSCPPERVTQLLALKGRTAERAGSIDHEPGAHDELANGAAGGMAAAAAACPRHARRPEVLPAGRDRCFPRAAPLHSGVARGASPHGSGSPSRSARKRRRGRSSAWRPS